MVIGRFLTDSELLSHLQSKGETSLGSGASHSHPPAVTRVPYSPTSPTYVLCSSPIPQLKDSPQIWGAPTFFLPQNPHPPGLAAERGHSRGDEEPYQLQDLGVGSLLEHTRQVAEANAPADEAVPVGVAVKVVVHNLGEAQDDVPEEGGVLHHMGVCCGDSHQPHQHSGPIPLALVFPP